MSKGYWIVTVDVSDPEGYKKYLAANPAAFLKEQFSALLAMPRRNRPRENASAARQTSTHWRWCSWRP